MLAKLHRECIRLLNGISIIDSVSFGFPQESAECEFIPGTDVLLIAAPIYNHSIIIIKSPNIIKSIKKILRRNEKALYSSRSARFLRVLRTCISEEKNIFDFASILRDQNDKLLKVVLNNINKELRAAIEERLALNL